MAIIPLLAAAFALTGQNPALPQASEEPPTLAKFIESMHWDPAKSGPLIALDVRAVELDDRTAPAKLSGFERKLVKAGGISAIVQNWTTALKDDDIPNAYDALSDSDKLSFLIATLRPGELKALFTNGLCARDLSGQQKAALLSLIPKNLTYTVGVIEGGGTRSNQEAETLPDEQRDEVRVQVHKGVSLAYGAASNGKGTTQSPMLSTLSYRGKRGAKVLISGRGHPFLGPKNAGSVVDNVEKKSDLSWSDPRLAKKIDLTASTTVGDAVDAIRNLTGIEIYADFRVARRDLYEYGDTCSAGDLLRGIAWALCGVVRQVGPAYVVTANKEGRGSLEARLAAIDAQGQIAIRSNVLAWRQAAAGANLVQNIPVPPDDPFHAGSIPESLFAPTDSEHLTNWVSLSQLPGAFQAAIDDRVQGALDNAKKQADFFAQHPEMKPPTPRVPRDSFTPVDSLAGKGRLSWEIGFRLVLPDGRPLEFQAYRPDGGVHIRYGGKQPAAALPIDASQIKPGGGIAVKSDDPRAVSTMCKDIKGYGVGEVWLESHSPAAIKAAVDSGLTVDLIIRPWFLMKGEACPDPDRNVLGMTGNKIGETPGIRFDLTSSRVWTFGDMISPGDPALAKHWSRLAALASTKGVHRVILFDTQPDGYQPPTSGASGSIRFTAAGSTQIQAGLPSRVPSIVEFGYSAEQRVEYLRAHKLDPIDISPSNFENRGPIFPYFDFQPMLTMGPRNDVYPGVHFPLVMRSGDMNADSAEWQKYRNDEFMKQFPSLGESLSKVCDSVLMVELFPENPMRIFGPVRFASPFAADGRLDWKQAAVNFMSVSPLTAEDDQGKIVYQPSFLPDMKTPFCFDLTDVSPDRLPTYLQYLLKMPIH